MKAHRGEPTDEKADIQADKAISGKDVPRIEVFGDGSVAIAHRNRARDLKNLGYPQVPGSISAKTLSTQTIRILSNRPSSKGSKLLFPVAKAIK